MNEYESLCNDTRNCTPYQHVHCAGCNTIVNVEPCCGDSTCHAYGYANGAECKTCTECILCSECVKKEPLCPHCAAYGAAVWNRQYAHG